MRVAIVGNFRYPYGDAASNRVTELAKAMSYGDCHVQIVTVQGRDVISEQNRRGAREGITFEVLENSVSLKLGRKLAGLKRFFSSRDLLLKALNRHLSDGLDLVIVYGSSAWLAGGVIHWGNKNGIAVVADVVEWYDINQCAGGLLGPFYYDSEAFMRRVSLKLDGVIAISEFLKSYYMDRGVKVHKVPGLASVNLEDKSVGSFLCGAGFEVLYSGFPGKKDVFSPILAAADYFSKSAVPVRFTLTGRDLEGAILSAGWSLAEVAALGNVDVVGWCSDSELAAIRQRADVAVVFRAPGRSSKANFPQKLAEYIAAGKPVIVNDIGDMANYVKGAQCGLVVEEASGKCLIDAIQKIIDGNVALDEMRKAALQCALSCFDYRAISSSLVAFLKGVRADSLERR